MVFKMPWDKVLCRIAAAAVTVAVTEEATAAAAVTATTAKTAAAVPPNRRTGPSLTWSSKWFQRCLGTRYCAE